MKGNLYQHIKIRHAYDFSLCFPHELLNEFLKYYLKTSRSVLSDIKRDNECFK